MDKATWSLWNAFPFRNIFVGIPEDEIERKFDILLDHHLKKLAAEIVLLNTDSFLQIKGSYNFKETEKRYHLLHRYCNAIESGMFDDIDSICDEFVTSLEENYKTAKEVIN